MDEYNKIISVYDKLCLQRNDSSFWAANIIDASQGITQQLVWQNFYAYLANENHVFTEAWQSSLGEAVDKGLVLNEGNVTFKTKEIQNGNVTFIRLTPDKNLNSSNKHGEQVARLPETISEISPGSLSETSDEKCEQ